MGKMVRTKKGGGFPGIITEAIVPLVLLKANSKFKNGIFGDKSIDIPFLKNMDDVKYSRDKNKRKIRGRAKKSKKRGASRRKRRVKGGIRGRSRGRGKRSKGKRSKKNKRSGKS